MALTPLDGKEQFNANEMDATCRALKNDAALQTIIKNLDTITGSDNYAIRLIPRHEPSEETTLILKTLRQNLLHEEQKAQRHFDIYKGEDETCEKLQKAKDNKHLGITKVDETIALLDQSLPNGYDHSKSMLDNYRALETICFQKKAPQQTLSPQ